MAAHVPCYVWLLFFACFVSIRLAHGQIEQAFLGTREKPTVLEIANDACRSEAIVTSPKITLKSVNWNKTGLVFIPTECVWIIRAPPGKMIEIYDVFLPAECGTFNISISDYGDKYNGKEQSYLYRGHYSCESYNTVIEAFSTEEFHSHTNGVKVSMFAITPQPLTDSFTEIEFRYTLYDAHPGCFNDVAELLTTSGGHRTSPYLYIMKNRILENSRCLWQIIAPKGHLVVLRWTQFRLGQNPNCSDDKVVVRNGGPNDKVAATLCGRHIPIAFTSTGRKVHINFTSDESMNWGRLNFTWTFVKKHTLSKQHHGCQSKRVLLRAESGIITSPTIRGTYLYKNNAKCSWLIVGPKGTLVQIHIEVFSLQSSNNCTKDAVTIYDGAKPMKRNIHAVLCGHDREGKHILGRRNVLLITFRSDSAEASMGFRITYRTRKLVRCGIPIHKPTVWPNVDPKFTPMKNGSSKTKRSTILKRVRRVLGGEEAVPNSWPWITLIMVKEKQRCEGIVVHRRWIVTVATCVVVQWLRSMEPNEWSIVTGLHNRLNATLHGETIKMKRIIMHPKFSWFSSAWDIAMVELESDIKFNDKVQPVCLPTQRVKSKSPCVVVGWGKTKDPASPRHLVLRQRTTKVISQKLCSRNEWWGFRSNNDTLCLGEQGSGYQITCSGDSGGPFTCKENGRWVLNGLSSIGPPSKECKKLNKPSIFTHILSYTKWIEHVTNGDVIAPRPHTRYYVLD